MENYLHQRNPKTGGNTTKSPFFPGPLPWTPTSRAVAVLVAIIATTIYIKGTIFMAMATVAYGSLILGLLWRRNRRVHPVAMLFGMVIDLSIVLILEIQRSAIDTALSFKLGPLQQAHIGASSLALLLYFPTIYMGWRLWNGWQTPALRRWHVRIAVTAFCFRSLGFLLMLSFLGRGK